MITQKEFRRYEHQIALEGVGSDGFEKIKNTTVAVVGLSGIGLAVIRSLMVAGIGKVIIFDNKFVAESDLCRQAFFDEKDIGRLKSVAFKDKLHERYSTSDINVFCTEFNEKTAQMHMPNNCKLIVAAAQNVEITKDVLDYAQAHNIIVVGGAVLDWKGIFGIFNHAKKDEIIAQVNKIGNDTKNVNLVPTLNSISITLGGTLATQTILAVVNDYTTPSLLFEFNAFTNEMQKLV